MLHNRSTHSLKFSAALVLLTALSFCQAPEPQSLPRFTSGTNYVEVPVIVQRSGKHVAGLSKDAFTLKQDGKAVPIATFQEVHHDAATTTASAAPGSAVPEQVVPPQITIIALDMVNTPNLDRAYFTQEFERWLSKSAKLPQPIGLVAIERGGVHILREFTTEPGQLLSAMHQLDGDQPTNHNNANHEVRELSDQLISNQQSQLANAADVGPTLAQTLMLRSADESMVRFQDRSSRIDTQLVIQQLAQALKGIPGRKSLLLVGSGFKFIDSTTVLKTITDGSQGLQYSVENGPETLNQAAYTWKVLNDANVAVYPIDTRRTVNTAFQTMDVTHVNTPSALSFEQNQQTDRDILTSFKMIAAATGGKPCFYRTDLDNCVREAVEDDRDYYLLGFYLSKKDDKPGWHKIDVALNQKASLRYREGFLIAKFNAEAQRKNDISLALKSPFAYTALPFTGHFLPGQGSGSRFELQIPPQSVTLEPQDGHMDFDVIAVARAAGGREAGHMNQHIERKLPAEAVNEIKTTGIDYKNKIDLPAGEYAVWFVIRDNLTGRTGSAVVPLKVE